MPLQLLAVIVLGLMCGSEMNVALFGHPTLHKQPIEAHIPVRASFAKLFGRIMPFWMALSTLLNLLLLLPFEHSNRLVWRIDAIALTIQVAAVGFSLIGPVPSIIALPDGRRIPSLVTGMPRSIAGMSTIGLEHWD